MRKGFTLIELIVVIAIIAILAAIIAPNAFKAIEKASRSATLGDFRTIKTASMAFYADTGVWPFDGCFGALLEEQASKSACGAGTGGITGWDGPYIEQWPSRTRWGGNYQLMNNNNVSWDVTDRDGESANTTPGATVGRYIRMDKTPLEVLVRLETQIDGGNSTTHSIGQHRWHKDTGDIFQYKLITTDATVKN